MMKASGNYSQFLDIKEKLTSRIEAQDVKDFNVIVHKNDVVRDSMAIRDIVVSDKVPVLKSTLYGDTTRTKLFRDTTYSSSKNVSTDWLDDSSVVSNIVKCCTTTNLEHRNKTIKVMDNTIKRKSRNEEENKLSLALTYMNNSKMILDPSRLMFQAALLFDEMQAYERAATCYQQSTINKTSAEVIVDTYDLPDDDVFKRKVERMSKFRLDAFLAERTKLRDHLIHSEKERQRLRCRASCCQLVRIYMLTPIANLEIAQHNITKAFRSCATAVEHNELLWYFHELIKTHDSNDKVEMTLEKQMIRGVAGPIAESHVNILHDLEAIDPTNLDVLNWLGKRYAEKCEFDLSQSYYKKVRDLTAPVLDMKDTLMLWRKEVKGPGGDTEEGRMLLAAIKDNISKGSLNSFQSDSRGVRERVREDYSTFGGKHEDSTTLIYTVPKQGWNTVSL